jgi:hypothetical protein
MSQLAIKVCADIQSEVEESNENNNCKTVIQGAQYLYDFTDVAHLASWTNGEGPLKFPIPATSTSGAAFREKAMGLEDGTTHSTLLGTYPQQVDNGVIQGIFSEFYTDNVTREAKSRDLELPRRCSFMAEVGFKKGAEDTAGVRFIFGVMDASGVIEFFPAVEATYDGELDRYEVDLSHLAGKKMRFVLRVEADEASDQNWAIWINPRVVQDMG